MAYNDWSDGTTEREMDELSVKKKKNLIISSVK